MWLVNILALSLSIQTTTLPSSRLPISLLAVAFDDKVPSRSMCMVACPGAGDTAETTLLGQGAVACNLAEIKDIRHGAVVVRNLLTNREELLTLAAAPDTAGAAAPLAAGPPPVPPLVRASTEPNVVTVSLQKASVEHYLFNLPDVLASALATPHFAEDGRGTKVMDGFELGEIKSGSVVEQIGLKDGDVILSVNGEALNNVTAVIRLAAQAQNMPEVTMSVRRKGRLMTFVFHTK